MIRTTLTTQTEFYFGDDRDCALHPQLGFCHASWGSRGCRNSEDKVLRHKARKFARLGMDGDEVERTCTFLAPEYRRLFCEHMRDIYGFPLADGPPIDA